METKDILLELRTKKGYSQEEVAEMAVSPICCLGILHLSIPKSIVMIRERKKAFCLPLVMNAAMRN